MYEQVVREHDETETFCSNGSCLDSLSELANWGSILDEHHLDNTIRDFKATGHCSENPNISCGICQMFLLKHVSPRSK
jgi:hypothetical protein